MDNSEATAKDDCEISQQPISLENNLQPVENVLPANDIINQKSNSENQSSVEIIDACSEITKVNSETNSAVSTDISLPPLPKDDKGQLIQSSASYSADFNTQNYSNYNYMYNYNNYYGYPYPQYQWDYTSQQYYQPYQNYYNYNYNANQVQTSKPPPPPPDAVQLPVEEKPVNKANMTIDDSNRYSPTAETDDDDTLKGLSENNKSDVIENPKQVDTSLPHSTQFQTMPSEQIEIQQNISENVDYKIQHPITLVQQSVLPLIPEIPSYNIPVQQPGYLNNSQIQMQSVEAVNELPSQQKNSLALNGKEDSVEKVSKSSTVLGKNQAKKRLMAFSMMKQKLQEQNNSINDNQNSDIGEGNDVEFVPELNVFQTVTKKKVITNKKVTKVIKAQQTIEQIEEMKKDELLQGNNAALYQHLLRSGGNEAPILQKLGIESLAERYSAKIREQDKRLKRHHHSRRDDSRRSHKHRRRSHSKSRSRSKSTEKPKMRALEVKSWKDFVTGGFHFDKFRRFKVDEAEEMKDKERKSRSKKRHGDSRSDGKKQNTESTISTDVEKGNSDQKLRYNLLDRKKEILKSFEVVTQEGDCTKDFPSYIIQHTKTKPVLKYSKNPAKATCHLQNRQQMLSTLLPEIEVIVHKFLSSMKPKKVKENPIDVDYNYIDDKILVMMKDINIYPFKGWWPKTCFIATQVKEDPNIEIDKDALINELTTSKRIKKSRFNDESLIDVRPTVPSKWDSDYDGSPATDKVADVEVSQTLVMNTNNIKENNPPNIGNQVEFIDTNLGIGENESNIAVNICPILPIQSQEPQGYAKLDTEYEKFLKIVSAEKTYEKVEKDVPNIIDQKENENNVSIKSVLSYDESVQNVSEEDASTKSSNGSISLSNITEEFKIDSPFVKSLTSIDITLKNQKNSAKKSKKLKKKENKKKKRKSSSSESSQDSDSESDSSSSEDSESDGTTDSSSIVEKKKKKKKSNDKKKNKRMKNYKKKKNSQKNKIIKSEDEKDDKNSSIINLLEKALNVEIKKKPIDCEEFKQKKNKRKHGKKDNKSYDDEDEFEIVKECLKETFTKLVKTDKVGKNQSFSCNTNAVNEVLKYLKLDDKEKKHKKSKKSSKRKYDSDVSDDEITLKKPKLDNSFIIENSENEKKKKKKKKKSMDSNELVLKKKSKKKSKTTDTSETEDGLGLKQNIINKDEDSDNFFGLRPNEWNLSNKSSMRGVIHHSNISSNDSLSINDTVKINKSKSLNLTSDENSCSTNDEKNKIELSRSTNVFEKERQKELIEDKLEIFDKNNDDKLNNIIGDKIKINLINCDDVKCNQEEECNFENDKILNTFNQRENNVLENKNNVHNTLKNKIINNEKQDLNGDLNIVVKPTQSKTVHQYDKPVISSLIKPPILGETISYRDKVKMNLKKLSISQHIPFVFGFTSPLNLMKPNNFKLEKNKKKIELTEEVKLKVDESEHLIFNKPKLVGCSQIPNNNITNEIPPKTDIEINNEVLNQSFNWEDSEESDSSHLSIRSNNTSENLSDAVENDQIKTKLLNNLNKSDTNLQDKILSNNMEVKELKQTFNLTERTRLDSNIREQELASNVENIFAEEKCSNLSNSIYLSKPKQHFISNLMVSHNDTESVFMTLPKKKESDFVCSTNLNIDDSEVFKIDNELITQWIYDWNKLDRSINEINNLTKNHFNINKLQIKRKSRWNIHSEDNSIQELQNFMNEQGELQNKIDNYTSNIDKLSNTFIPFNNIDETSENHNLSYSDVLVNNDNGHSEICPNEYDDYSQSYHSGTCSNKYDDYYQSYYSETCPNEYDDYSQSYDQYLHEPIYSEMKTIEDNQLNSVDYNLYEKYNTTCDFHDEDYNACKFKDTSQHLTVSEVSSSIQVGNDIENLHSEDILNSENGVNENIVTIIPDIQDEIVNNVKSDATCDEQFFQLYQQHFQHYNQNPIKYSMSEPVLDNISEVNINTPENLPSQEDLDTDLEHDKTIPIPLRERAYSRIIQDNNTCVYITSDNYIAYCAIEDRCMVHVAIDPCNYDGIEEKVRHCFNINENGSIAEYWLHADLIPFNAPSDSESGVFSDEDDSVVSDSSQDDNIDNDIDDDNDDGDDNDSNNDDYDLIDADYEIVDTSSENDDNWMKDPQVLNKYGGVEQVVINQEGNVSSSSEYDSDKSDSESEDCYVTTFSNENQNINDSQMWFKTEDKESKSQYILGVNQTENATTSSNLHVENSNVDQLVLDIKSKIANRSIEIQDSILNCSENEKNKFDDNKLQSNIDEPMSIDVEYNENNSLNSKQFTEIDQIDKLVLNIKSEINSNTLRTNADLISVMDTENNDNIKFEEKEKDNNDDSGFTSEDVITIKELTKLNAVIKQQLLIQRLQIRAREKTHQKQPDTAMICYSDNMETIKHPFLGLFQPPTISILSKPRNKASKLSKRVTFADGIYPGDNLATSPMHDDVDRPLSPPPIKALMREALKLKRNMYPFKKSKVRTKLKMVDKKVAKVTPVIKDTNSSVIEYYISRHRLEVLPNNNVKLFDDSPNSDNDNNRSGQIVPLRPTRDVTPVPSDNECWNDDDNNTKDNNQF